MSDDDSAPTVVEAEDTTTVSASTSANDAEQAHREVVARLVHGGRERQRRSDIDVLPWREVQDASS